MLLLFCIQESLAIRSEKVRLQQQLDETRKKKEAAEAAAAAAEVAATLSKSQHLSASQQNEALTAELEQLRQLGKRESEAHAEAVTKLQQQYARAAGQKLLPSLVLRMTLMVLRL